MATADFSKRGFTDDEAQGALDLCNVKALNLSENVLETASFLPSTIVTLSLSCNQLCDLADLASLPLLEELDVSYNNLTSTSGLGASSRLRVLNLSHNAIATVDGMEGMDALLQLDLSSNRISTWPALRALSCTKSIVELRIANNPICRGGPGGLGSSLRQQILDTMPSVQVLDSALMAPSSGRRQGSYAALHLARNPAFALRCQEVATAAKVAAEIAAEQLQRRHEEEYAATGAPSKPAQDGFSDDGWSGPTAHTTHDPLLQTPERTRPPSWRQSLRGSDAEYSTRVSDWRRPAWSPPCSAIPAGSKARRGSARVPRSSVTEGGSSRSRLRASRCMGPRTPSAYPPAAARQGSPSKLDHIAIAEPDTEPTRDPEVAAGCSDTPARQALRYLRSARGVIHGAAATPSPEAATPSHNSHTVGSAPSSARFAAASIASSSRGRGGRRRRQQPTRRTPQKGRAPGLAAAAANGSVAPTLQHGATAEEGTRDDEELEAALRALVDKKRRTLARLNAALGQHQ